MTRPASDNQWLLATTLQVAVPVLLADLARLTPRQRGRTIARWAAEGADAIAHQGDALMYGGKRGQAAKAFDATARGVAAGAHAAGGMVIFGVLFCAAHTPGGLAVDQAVHCCPDCPTGEVQDQPAPVHATIVATVRDQLL